MRRGEALKRRPRFSKINKEAEVDAKEMNRGPETNSGPFSQEDYAAMKEAVRKAEKNSSGEIRVKNRQGFTEGLEGDLDAQALRDFAKEGLHNTRDKTGVLVL